MVDVYWYKISVPQSRDVSSQQIEMGNMLLLVAAKIKKRQCNITLDN